MYSFKFKDLNYKANFKNSDKKRKKLLILPGLGCSSDEYDFLLRVNDLKYQVLIIEMPGHNFTSNNLRDDYLLDFAKKLFFFLKKKNFNKLTFYAHSMSCIVIILLFKKFIRNSFLFNVIINEGNFIESDCSNVTKKTISYDQSFFKKKGFNNLLNVCNKSDDVSIKNWSDSLKKISAKSFYNYSKSCFFWSKKNYLLSYYKFFFKKKIYIYGENSKNLILLSRLNGERKSCIFKAGHFSHQYNKNDIKNILIKFLKTNK